MKECLFRCLKTDHRPAGGEVRGDGHGVGGEVAQDPVDLRIVGIGSRIETRGQSFGRISTDGIAFGRGYLD